MTGGTWRFIYAVVASMLPMACAPKSCPEPTLPENVPAKEPLAEPGGSAAVPAENRTHETPGALVESAPISGWFLAGNARTQYRMGPDRDIKHTGALSARLWAVEDPGARFGTLMQISSAEPYRGKRLEFSAFVKTSGVSGWTGLWMRVDRSNGEMGAFDNMQDRPLSGSADWQKYNVVLDVADDAKNIAFGVLQEGPGSSWIDDATLEVVDRTVQTTDTNHTTTSPTNLDFEDS